MLRRIAIGLGLVAAVHGVSTTANAAAEIFMYGSTGKLMEA